MKNSAGRLALLSSVSTAAAIFLLPGAAQAQATTCSQVATTITCVDGTATVLTATTSPTTTTTAGPGLVTVDTTGPSTTNYAAIGPFTTTAVPAVSLTSTGGALTFQQNATLPVNITTIGGASANALTINTTGQSALVRVGNIATSGTNSFGVQVTGGTDLTLSTGTITTTGATSTAFDAANQTGNVSVAVGNVSATGRGLRILTGSAGTNTITTGNLVTGDRGLLANGGTVSVTTGNVTTSTNGSTTPGGYGVAAQAFSGNSTVRTGTVNTVNGAGIIASAFSPTGSVDIGGCPSVSTVGNNSTAIVAQTAGVGSIVINCGVLTTTGDNSNGVFAVATTGTVLVNITSATTSGVGAYGVTANTNGIGTVTTNAGVINTTGAGATGLFSRAGTGALDIGYGNITTSGIANTGNSAAALDVLSNSNINLRGAGSTLRSNGAGVITALVSGAGVTGNLGNVTATGVGAQGALISSTTAPINLTIGTVATTGNGVFVSAGSNAVTLTTGTVTATEAGASGTVINSTGAVTFNGAKQTANGNNALRILGGAGAINATVAGATTTGMATAVSINAGGPVTFVNTGTINTSGANSNGIIISGATTASVTCGIVSTIGTNSPAVTVSASGTTNVNCGTISTTGALSDGIVVSNTAGTTTVTGGTTTATGVGSRGIVVSSSAPAATGLVTVNTGVVSANSNAVVASSTGGANVVVNTTGGVTSTTGTGITATTGGSTLVTINTGNTVTGVQGVSLQGTAGNTLIVNGTLSNTVPGTTPYTVLNGGPFTLTLGATGTINGPLAFTTGNDTFNNFNTFALPAALDFGTGTDVFNNSNVVTAFTGTSVVSNLETFNNIGALLDMRDGAANDVASFAGANFVATGNARLGIDVVGVGAVNIADRLVIGGATGVTTILPNFINPTIDVTGPLIVDSTLNSLVAGQFVLSGPTTFGLINYGLQVRGGDLFLTSTPGAQTYDVVFVGRQARELWYTSADAYNSYATARRISYGQDRSHPLGIWAQLYGERQTSGENSRTATAFGATLAVADRIRTNYRGAQGGIDFGTTNFVIGVTGGYERAEGTSNTGALIRTEGHNYGAYAQFGMTTGLYIGALVKRDENRARFTNGAIANGFANPKVRSTGVEGEIGFRTGGADTINFDLGAGVAYVDTSMDTFNFGNITFAENSLKSVRGRLHARATFAGAVAPFIEVRGFHEFRGNNSYTLNSGSNFTTLDGGAKGTYARIEAGLGGGSKGGPMISAWADVGDTTGYGLRAGFRF